MIIFFTEKLGLEKFYPIPITKNVVVVSKSPNAAVAVKRDIFILLNFYKILL